jgi:hypothetical protein
VLGLTAVGLAEATDTKKLTDLTQQVRNLGERLVRASARELRASTGELGWEEALTDAKALWAMEGLLFQVRPSVPSVRRCAGGAGKGGWGVGEEGPGGGKGRRGGGRLGGWAPMLICWSTN